MGLRVRLCRLDEVPAQGLASFAVAGVDWPVLVARVDGLILAAASVCPHEDVSLADGSFAAGRVTCPGHGYEFDLRTGRCSHDKRMHLRRYQVTIAGDQVYVDLI